ncbi:alpha/beta hydrolase [Prevotella sp. MGM1]|nr:alpha/beta hydrolase [Prevotella sp. MGM1]
MLAADMYVPKSAEGRLAAIAVCGPFGAVKEQCSGLYAQEFAERGFITVAFDPSFTGESGGTPRSVASPDINTEDFSAAVDFLTTLDNVDKERIGILGICGWGGFSINAAAVDTRIKATVASTMYDISRCQSAGYFDASDSDSARHEMRVRLSAQRTEDAHTGTYRRTVIYADEIRSAVLLVHGENAHSRYFSEDTFKSLKGGNKRLLIVPGAVHTDLYDKTDVIPFDEIAGFYMTYLK